MSLYAKWFHWILSELIGPNEWELRGCTLNSLIHWTRIRELHTHFVVVFFHLFLGIRVIIFSSYAFHFLQKSSIGSYVCPCWYWSCNMLQQTTILVLVPFIFHFQCLANMIWKQVTIQIPKLSLMECCKLPSPNPSRDCKATLMELKVFDLKEIKGHKS